MAVKTAPKKQGKAPAAAKGGKDGYDNTNRGVLFINDKGDNAARPDFTGTLSIVPADYEVDEAGNINIRMAAWNRESEKVGQYLSINAQPLTK